MSHTPIRPSSEAQELFPDMKGKSPEFLGMIECFGIPPEKLEDVFWGEGSLGITFSDDLALSLSWHSSGFSPGCSVNIPQIIVNSQEKKHVDF